MADPKHLEILKQGVEAWNRWREENKIVTPNLKHADFNRFNLRGADLRRADLSEANLNAATLINAKLSGAMLNKANLINASLNAADLTEANLTGADLTNASLNGARLVKANLSGARIGNADFHGAILSGTRMNDAHLMAAKFVMSQLDGADFNKATIGFTLFAGTDLSGVMGLENVTHGFPSTIGLDTFFASKGKIPEAFLKGAGVPDIFIEYASSLAGKTIEFYSAFISYSSNDSELAERLHSDLQTNGVRCWLFSEDAKWGEPAWGEIDRGIKVHDKLLVICSEHSLQSEPVLREIERALQREDQEHKSVLFPVRIDNYIFEKWEHHRKSDVVGKVVGDFSNWQDHNSYKKAFDHLLRDLKSDKPAK
jgi:hypothetical protein